MKRTIAAATVAVCALTTPALAEGITLYGPGSTKGGCGEWARAATDSTLDISYMSWLLGYLSAVNKFRSIINNSLLADAMDGRANYSVLDWMKLWCRAHPLDQPVMCSSRYLI
jgi:hypothetical protein